MPSYSKTAKVSKEVNRMTPVMGTRRYNFLNSMYTDPDRQSPQCTALQTDRQTTIIMMPTAFPYCVWGHCMQ